MKKFTQGHIYFIQNSLQKLLAFNSDLKNEPIDKNVYTFRTYSFKDRLIIDVACKILTKIFYVHRVKLLTVKIHARAIGLGQ
jgi:hypothetical protein